MKVYHSKDTFQVSIKKEELPAVIAAIRSLSEDNTCETFQADHGRKVIFSVDNDEDIIEALKEDLRKVKERKGL